MATPALHRRQRVEIKINSSNLVFELFFKNDRADGKKKKFNSPLDRLQGPRRVKGVGAGRCGVRNVSAEIFIRALRIQQRGSFVFPAGVIFGSTFGKLNIYRI